MSVLGRGRLPDQPAHSAASAGRPAAAQFSGCLVLLVEDNAINREFAIELLRSVDIQADQAMDGEEAVKWCSSNVTIAC